MFCISLSDVINKVMISMMSRFVPLNRSVIEEGSVSGMLTEEVRPRAGIYLINRPRDS